jgi:alkanesulfonate monooxygenase
VLAKVATTVDQISGGRVEIGIGAGWWEEEHRAYGFPFPPVPERFGLFEEQVEIVHGLLTQDRFSFQGAHYRLEDCGFLHRPVQRPHPPIILGGTRVGSRMQRLVARFADEFNTVGGTPEEVRDRFARIRAALREAGRDPSQVRTSLMTWFYVGRDEDEVRDRVERARQRDPRAGSFEEHLAEVSRDCIVGTPGQAIARLREYEAAGVERIILNHELVDDLDHVELLAREILPALASG